MSGHLTGRFLCLTWPGANSINYVGCVICRLQINITAKALPDFYSFSTCKTYIYKSDNLLRIFRLPLDSYDDGEVSFSHSVKRRLFLYSSLNNEFSDDEENDVNVVTNVSNDKKTVVRRLFYSFVSVMLFPLLIIYRLFAKTTEVVHKTFSHFFSFLWSLTSRIFRRWESAKVNYNSFMSTNIVETTTEREELLTDDENKREDPQFKVPKVRPTSKVTILRQSEETLVTPLFSRFCQLLYTIKSFFTKTATTTTTATTTSSNAVVDGDEVEASWIEIVIIRRIVRIFR